MRTTRRDLFLRWGPAALLAYPVLRATRGLGQAPTGPKRFITFFSSSGVRPDVFWPVGEPGRHSSGSYSVRGTSLEALEPHLAKILIPKGIEIDRGPGDSHDAGSVAILTGDYLRSTDVADTFAHGESLDGLLSRRIGGDTPEPLLVLGTRLEVNRISKYISFHEDGSYRDYIQSPYTAYDRLFRHLVDDSCGGDAASADFERARFRRRSVLDAVLAQTHAMTTAYGMNAGERAKLERMQDGIRSVERRLDETVAVGGLTAERCSAVRSQFDDPTVPNSDENFPELLRLHMDLVALAVELDLTRVFTLSLSLGGSGGAPMTWLQWEDAGGVRRPIEASHHNVSHGTQRGVENFSEKLQVIDRWNFEQFAYLAAALDAIPDGDGTALDNSVLWYASDNGYGKTHDKVNMPFIVAGNAGGAFPTGQYVEVSGSPPHQRLLMTFLRAMGIDDIDVFGREESSARGPLF